MSGFASMGLCPELLQALEDAGYENPTPIQEKAIPPALLGKDIMGCAQTGTGKTAAFTLPMLHTLRNEEPGSLRALILVPTRELAIQVGRNIRTYATHMKLRTTAVYGGVPMDPQEMMLRYGVDVLVATPGRLKDHMWRGNIDYRHTRYLVLDEADRMLDMGFIDAVREIVREIPAERQTMLFSATLDNEIKRLARDILRDPERIEVAPPTSTAEGVEQILIDVGHDSKRDVIDQVLRLPDMDRTLVFTRTKRGASSLSSYLKSRGYRCTSIHSDKTQERRLEALNAFRDGHVDVLVATDIAARGLDVTGISHVVNFDLPHSPEDYVHRIGRTARAGTKGMAISLMGAEETRGLAAIERHLGKRLILSRLDETGNLQPLGGGDVITSRPATSESTSGSGSRRGSRGGSRGGRGRSGSVRSNETGVARTVNGSVAAAAGSNGNRANGTSPARRPRHRDDNGNGRGTAAPEPAYSNALASAEGPARDGDAGDKRPRRSRGGRGRRKEGAPSSIERVTNSATLGTNGNAPSSGKESRASQPVAASNGGTKGHGARPNNARSQRAATGETFRALTAREHQEQLRRARREKEGNLFTRIIAKLGLKAD